MAVEAGADVVLACGSREAQVATGEALLDAVKRGAITAERLDASVSRILALKERYLSRPVPRGPDPEARDYMRSVARAGITLVKDEAKMVPLKAQKVLLVAPTRLPTSMLGELDVTLPLADFLRQRGYTVEELSFSLQDTGVDREPFARAAEASDAIVACLHARDRLSVTQVELAYTLSSSEKPLAIVAVNSPYILMDVPWAQTYLCTYGYGRSTMEALADVFKGRGAPGGRLPVSIPGLYSAGWRANAGTG